MTSLNWTAIVLFLGFVIIFRLRFYLHINFNLMPVPGIHTYFAVLVT